MQNEHRKILSYYIIVRHQFTVLSRCEEDRENGGESSKLILRTFTRYKSGVASAETQISETILILIIIEFKVYGWLSCQFHPEEILFNQLASSVNCFFSVACTSLLYTGRWYYILAPQACDVYCPIVAKTVFLTK